MNDHDLITTMRESFTDVRSATPVDQIVSRSKVIRARRRIPGAVAVAAVAAAAGTAVALIPAGSAKPAPVVTKTTAYVVSHVTRALDAMPGNTVFFMQMTTVPASSGNISDHWDAGQQSRMESFTLTGQPVVDGLISLSGPITHMTQTIIDVNYQNKTWWRASNYYGNGSVPATRWNCTNATTDSIDGNAQEMAAQLHTLLSCGELKVVGSGTVNGVPTVKLSGDFQGGPETTYWVNARTFLPFRFTAPRGGGAPMLEWNMQWLPATAANLAKLNVPIPAGFTQVPPRT
jgi:hypothetical protein